MFEEVIILEKYKTSSYEETYKLAGEFVKTLKENDIVLLNGDLGAGKTCFTNGMLYAIGFSQGGSSPTFTIVNQYPSNPKINHFDLYRITDEDELYEIGFLEYLTDGSINIIEWPVNAFSLLEGYKTIKVNISFTDIDDERIITIER